MKNYCLDVNAPLFVNMGGGYYPAIEFLNIDSSFLYASLPFRSRIIKLVAKMGITSKQAILLAKTNYKLLRHNLAKGIPLPDNSVDFLYSSHVIEHIPKHLLNTHLEECYRVLKPDGIYRIVAPDLLVIAKKYSFVAENFDVESKVQDLNELNDIASDMFEQMIPVYPKHWETRPFLLQIILRMMIGDTRRSGDAHTWMYTSTELSWLALNKCRYKSAIKANFNTSTSPFFQSGFPHDSLDLQLLKPRKNNSLYLELSK